jgi:hypothetical protein
MSHPNFKNKGNALGRLIEEAGEVIHAAGKTVRFGWESYNPFPGQSRETNEEWLMREIADFEDAVARLKRERGWER